MLLVFSCCSGAVGVWSHQSTVALWLWRTIGLLYMGLVCQLQAEGPVAIIHGAKLLCLVMYLKVDVAAQFARLPSCHAGAWGLAVGTGAVNDCNC